MINTFTVSAPDCIFLADSVSDPFQDIYVITTKGHFLDLLMQDMPYALIAKGDDVNINAKVSFLIQHSDIQVREFVDFTTTPPTVCVNASTVGEDEIYKAFELISKAIDINSGPMGKWSAAYSITYCLSDLTHLLNWH